MARVTRSETRVCPVLPRVWLRPTHATGYQWLTSIDRLSHNVAMQATIELDAAVLAKVERDAKATGRGVGEVLGDIVREHYTAPSKSEGTSQTKIAHGAARNPIEHAPFRIRPFGGGGRGPHPDIDWSSYGSIIESIERVEAEQSDEQPAPLKAQD